MYFVLVISLNFDVNLDHDLTWFFQNILDKREMRRRICLPKFLIKVSRFILIFIESGVYILTCLLS